MEGEKISEDKTTKTGVFCMDFLGKSLSNALNIAMFNPFVKLIGILSLGIKLLNNLKFFA